MKMPQATFLFTAEVSYAFFGFQLAPSTYSTFGILRFTVLSRLGRAEL
jgi:hypothetical protein